MNGPGRGGFSLVELLVALALLALVAFKAAYVLDSVFRFSRSTSSAMVLDEAAERMLDKIVYALMGADRDTLLPAAEAPLSSSSITYRISFGMENGEVVWSAPESISLEDQRSLVWRQNPDEAAERKAVWTNIVRPFLEGEQANGADDNGNGLVDESGISFAMDGRTVVIRLTLCDESGQTAEAVRTVEATAACRNFVERRDGLDIQYL